MHARVGVPVTIATLAITVGYLRLRLRGAGCRPPVRILLTIMRSSSTW
jgi:hypothetical protein